MEMQGWALIADRDIAEQRQNLAVDHFPDTRQSAAR
jgi:hypothetical protein